MFFLGSSLNTWVKSVAFLSDPALETRRHIFTLCLSLSIYLHNVTQQHGYNYRVTRSRILGGVVKGKHLVAMETW